MDPICSEIYDIIVQKNYRALFNYDIKSLQIFFDTLCMSQSSNSNELNGMLSLLLQLFPDISILNAIIHSYINNDKALFELLTAYIDEKFKLDNKDFLMILITQSSSYYNGDRNRYILPELLQILVCKRTFNCDDLLICATEMNIFRLARLSFKYSSKEAKITSFTIAYKKGYYEITEMIYKYICNERVSMDKNIGYCPSGAIIELVNYQEFYDWKIQFAESVNERNYYALESLVNKVPYKIGIQFTMIEPLLLSCPDTLLYLILRKYVIENINSVDVDAYNRRPLRDYIKQMNPIGGWIEMREEKTEYLQ